MIYQKEACYLSDYGVMLIGCLRAKGIDEDLALEILHLLVPEAELYDLEVAENEFF